MQSEKITLENSTRQMTNGGARKVLPFDISSDHRVFAIKQLFRLYICFKQFSDFVLYLIIKDS